MDDGITHLRNLLLSIDVFLGSLFRTIGLTPFLYLHHNAGNGIFQDGMFHKNRCKKLEKLSMDSGKQVWYDIYVGRLP